MPLLFFAADLPLLPLLLVFLVAPLVSDAALDDADALELVEAAVEADARESTLSSEDPASSASNWSHFLRRGRLPPRQQAQVVRDALGAVQEHLPQRRGGAVEPRLEVRHLGCLRRRRGPRRRARLRRRLLGGRRRVRGLRGAHQPAEPAEPATTSGGRGGNVVVRGRGFFWRGLFGAGRREGAGEGVEGGPEVGRGGVAALREPDRLLEADAKMK